jgi:hypothetical protein
MANEISIHNKQAGTLNMGMSLVDAVNRETVMKNELEVE